MWHRRQVAISKRSHCPIAYALDAFGDRWTLLVVRDLMFKGKRRYLEFAAAGEGIATNVLAARLSRLHKDGIVGVTIDPDDGRSKLYALTAKGLDLAPLLIEMILWSAKYDPYSAVETAFVKRARENKAALLKQIRAANRAARS